MAVHTTFVCEHCGRILTDQAPDWFILSQPNQSRDHNVKLQKQLCFCSPKCLSAWAELLLNRWEIIKESVRDLPGPHGSYISQEKGMRWVYF